MKSKIQLLIIVLGVVSLVVGIRQILQMPIMILPSWFLLLFPLPITLCCSFALGYMAKKVMNSKWQSSTFAAIFVIIFCSIFYIIQYKPIYRIVIPKSYAGEVRLLVSNEKENDFFINKYSIGYIDKKTFDEGFYPKIIKGNNDITKQVNNA
jgi:hypothetical protein